jgi:hypothetical protein
MSASPLLEFSLVSLHSLDLIDIILLSGVSKSLWRAMRSLTEVRCRKAVTDSVLEKSLNFFSGVKLLSINAKHFDWGMMNRILSHSQVSLLCLDFLSLSGPQPDATESVSEITSCVNNLRLSSNSCSNSRWAHIRCVDLLNCQSSGVALEHLVGGCRNVLKFSLHGSLYVRDQNIHIMLLGMCVLENLDFSQLPGLQRLVFTSNLQRSLKILRVTKCTFLRDIVVTKSTLGMFESLTLCDLSSTAVSPECVTRLACCSPQLQTLILKESSSIVGTLFIMSQSLKHIDLQQTCNMTRLTVTCPNLNRLDVLGCLGLKKVVINSSKLTNLDLSMLSKLSYLEINCPCINDINFSGCRKLSTAKITSSSPLSASFRTRYFRSKNVVQNTVLHDLDYMHFGVSTENVSSVCPSVSHDLQPSNARILRSKFLRRSSSI